MILKCPLFCCIRTLYDCSGHRVSSLGLALQKVLVEGRQRYLGVAIDLAAHQRGSSLRWKGCWLSHLLNAGERDYGLVIAVIEIDRREMLLVRRHCPDRVDSLKGGYG